MPSLYFSIASAEADRIIYIKMSEMISTKRHLISDCISYLFNIFCKACQTFICDLYLGKRMYCISITHIFPEIILAGCSIPEFGIDKCIRNVSNNMNPKIHFKPGKALFFNSFFHGYCKSLWIPGTGSISIQSYFIAISATKQLPCRNTISFAAQIPECHFNSTYTTTLASMITILPDYFKNHFNITWIQTQNPAFKEQCIAVISSIPYFTETINALVCINPYNCVLLAIMAHRISVILRSDGLDERLTFEVVWAIVSSIERCISPPRAIPPSALFLRKFLRRYLLPEY